MKRQMRYIRYRICRSIYYADQCPVENRKNYGAIGSVVLSAIGMGLFVLVMMFVFVSMA